MVFINIHICIYNAYVFYITFRYTPIAGKDLTELMKMPKVRHFLFGTPFSVMHAGQEYISTWNSKKGIIEILREHQWIDIRIYVYLSLFTIIM